MKMWTYGQLYPKPPASRRPSPPHEVRFWKIEEAVGGGNYIILPGIYTTQADAKRAFPVGGWCKAVEYQQGRGTDGPVRVT